jgi:hypothetical protein
MLTVSTEDKVAPVDLLQISPNPARDQISINYSGDDDALSELKLIDLVGKEVARYYLNNNDAVIDISLQPCGIYVLRLKTKSKYLTRKLVISR